MSDDETKRYSLYKEWQLSPMKISELLPEPPKATPEPKKKGRSKAAKEEPAQ